MSQICHKSHYKIQWFLYIWNIYWVPIWVDHERVGSKPPWVPNYLDYYRFGASQTKLVYGRNFLLAQEESFTWLALPVKREGVGKRNWVLFAFNKHNVYCNNNFNGCLILSIICLHISFPIPQHCKHSLFFNICKHPT